MNMDTMMINSKAEMFKALGSVSRLQIIDLLKHHDAMSVTELANALEISQPGVSQHLRVLRNVELVRTKRKGNNQIYTLDPIGLARWHDVHAEVCTCGQHVPGYVREAELQKAHDSKLALLEQYEQELQEQFEDMKSKFQAVISKFEAVKSKM